MTHSGFKTAQKIVNLEKKENNNKDYKCKQLFMVIKHIKYIKQIL